MGIGGIESSVATGNVRSLNTKTTTAAPEVNGVSKAAYVDKQTPVVQAAEQHSGAGEQQGGYENQQAMYGEGVPIQDVSKEKVESALRDINAKIRPTHTECQFSYHEDTKRISIKVLNQDTGEVIKEIPPEKTLDMIAKTLELAGILVDEKR